jgi:hypothetical protein
MARQGMTMPNWTDGLGKRAARLLSDKFSSMGDLLRFLESEHLDREDGFGPKTYQEVLCWLEAAGLDLKPIFSRRSQKDNLERLRRIDKILRYKGYKGLTFSGLVQLRGGYCRKDGIVMMLDDGVEQTLFWADLLNGSIEKGDGEWSAAVSNLRYIADQLQESMRLSQSSATDKAR